jgi:hypothetical protein
MKYLILACCLILTSCGNKKPQITQNPKNEKEVEQISYDPGVSDIILINNDNYDNFYKIEVPENEVFAISLKVKANKTIGEVKSIRSSSDVVIPQDCVKTYIEDEECPIEIPFNETIKGLKVIRLATSMGNRFFLIVINRTNPQASSQVTVTGPSDFGDLVEKQSVIKTFTIKNIGESISENINVALSGEDKNSYRIVHNSCQGKNLNKNGRCMVKVVFNSEQKTTGNFKGQIIVNSQSQTVPYSVQSEVVTSTVSNSPPQLTIPDLAIVAGDLFNLPLSAQDLDGDNLTFYANSSTLNTTINSMGFLTINPNVDQVGSHNVEVYVSDNKSPATRVVVPVTVYPQMIYAGSSSFMEGEIKSPLFSVSFNPGVKITEVKTSIDQVATIVRISGSAVSSLINPLPNGINLPINSANTGSVTYNIDGAVKYAGSYDVNFEVTLQNGHKINYLKTLNIQPANLPIVKYNLFAVKNQAGTQTGYDGFSILNSAYDLYRQSQNWRTPILTSLRHEVLNCNTSSSFEASNQTHLNCLRDNSFEDSETGFIFNQVTSGGSAIGGIANGTKKSFVIEKYPWSHTLAHELGHQWGLWHTFESYWNDELIHCTSSSFDSCFYRSLYENTPGKSLSTPGDWANFKVDFDSASGIVPFNYTAIDDTHIDYFNGFVYSLNNLGQNLGLPNPGGYTNGTSLVLYKGGQSYTAAQGNYACHQIRTTNGGTVSNGHLYDNPVYCPSIPGRVSNYLIPEATVKNTMSYWYHEDGSARFSEGQKQRMNQVLSIYPELISP